MKSESKIRFKIGDIIHNNKDNIIFLVMSMTRKDLKLFFYDKNLNFKPIQMNITKNNVCEQIKRFPDLLIHYPVKK